MLLEGKKKKARRFRKDLKKKKERKKSCFMDFFITNFIYFINNLN